MDDDVVKAMDLALSAQPVELPLCFTIAICGYGFWNLRDLKNLRFLSKCYKDYCKKRPEGEQGVRLLNRWVCNMIDASTYELGGTMGRSTANTRRKL